MTQRSEQAHQMIDPDQFRQVLGHYPTGVVVVSGIDDGGLPQGMVIGSFASVSLDPPLVAYFPTKSSRTYERLRTSASFCVNVMAAGQEELCRHFTGPSKDKFADVSWRPAPSGAPILSEAVAWIDCEPHAVHDAGDHEIVLGRVTKLDVQNAQNPLLFFQGGYGRFSHRALVTAEPDVIEAVGLAERGRDLLQNLANDLDVEVDVMARSGSEVVFVASAVPPGTAPRAALGTRVPLMAPLGELHLTGCPDEDFDAWAKASLMKDEAACDQQVTRAQQAVERGWSASLAGGRAENDLLSAVRQYSSGDLTPVQHRDVAARIAEATPFYPPFEVVEGEQPSPANGRPAEERRCRRRASLDRSWATYRASTGCQPPWQLT